MKHITYLHVNYILQGDINILYIINIIQYTNVEIFVPLTEFC